MSLHDERHLNFFFLTPSTVSAMSDDDEEGIERRFTILYGTETGNSQDVAERIARQARRRQIATNVFSMDEYDIVSLTQYLTTSMLTP
jgi:sulfite reductase alpha subunit-like flavoprotein